MLGKQAFCRCWYSRQIDDFTYSRRRHRVVPGQRHQVIERMAVIAEHLGTGGKITDFAHPDDHRDVDDVEKKLGLHRRLQFNQAAQERHSVEVRGAAIEGKNR
ncbi:hypothetical protein D3C84_979420 [compost metagenome]